MCTRCIRFMAEVAKDPVLDMRERGNLNEITVVPGPEARGALHVHDRARLPGRRAHDEGLPLQGARLVPAHGGRACARAARPGCNAHLDYDPRYNKAYRYRPRDNEKVNKYWMCDEGMLSYKEAHDGRVLEATVARRDDVDGSRRSRRRSRALRRRADGIGRGRPRARSYSLEDNWALRELALVLMGSKNLYWSGRADGYEDDILIHRDKNSNTRGVRELAPGAKPFQALLDDVAAGRVTHVIALGGRGARGRGGARAARRS